GAPATTVFNSGLYVGAVLSLGAGQHRSIRDADATSATDLQRGFSASYFRRIAALEQGKACF
ncbi:hypothetical protein, partial [Achromobacter sp. 413638]|uniref:hypothetical protein n=1 Tax=Achromobacter sp. 413638 TaxID=3342385 RepID=UPI00370A8EAB